MQTITTILTLVIGAIALYIAYQQWRTNEKNRLLNLYEKRVKVYQYVIKTFSMIMSSAHPKITDLYDFRRQTAEAVFIFGPEINEYIEEIYKRGVKLRYANGQYRDANQDRPAGYDHEAIVNLAHEQLTWFGEQFPIALEKFKKYLDVSR